MRDLSTEKAKRFEALPEVARRIIMIRAARRVFHLVALCPENITPRAWATEAIDIAELLCAGSGNALKKAFKLWDEHRQKGARIFDHVERSEKNERARRASIFATDAAMCALHAELQSHKLTSAIRAAEYAFEEEGAAAQLVEIVRDIDFLYEEFNG